MLNETTEVIDVESREVEDGEDSRVVTLTPAEFEVLSRVPAVAAPNAAPSRSERYKHVNTREIVDALKAEGFYVDRAKYTKTRKPRKGNPDAAPRDPLYAKHQVILRSESLPKTGERAPEIYITNAHDGTSSVDIMEGVFEFVCENGLIIGDTYGRERIRHAGRQAEEVIDRVLKMTRGTERWLRQIEEWKGIEISPAARREYARLATVLRYGDDQRFKPELLLEARRAEDDNGSLWSVYQRVQENAVKGGFEGLAKTGRRQAARPLTEIAKYGQFNADLWKLTEEFA